MAVHDLIKEYMSEHQRIVFNGNGYSDEWVKEAERRGLPNIKSMVEAAQTLTTEKAIKLFEKFGIFTKVELESREEVIYETYAKTINIEALTMIGMASKNPCGSRLYKNSGRYRTGSKGSRCGCFRTGRASRRSQCRAFKSKGSFDRTGKGSGRGFRYRGCKDTGILL